MLEKVRLIKIGESGRNYTVPKNYEIESDELDKTYVRSNRYRDNFTPGLHYISRSNQTCHVSYPSYIVKDTTPMIYIV